MYGVATKNCLSMTAAQPFARFAYRPSPDQRAAAPAHHPVLIVGAGPVGLTLAIDLALRGVKAVVLDDSDRIGEGSRAICFAKRTLEIFDRLGVAAPMLEKGVRWSVGKVFRGDALLYRFDLLPEEGHKMPAFINLQQFHVEKHLVERALALGVDIRWLNRVTGVAQVDGRAVLHVETPDGPYALQSDWAVACDGARSPMRGLLGLAFEGEQFDDQFLIADVRMTPISPWSAGSGSIRPSIPAAPACCTSSRTTSGASTCSSRRTPTPSMSAGPRWCVRASRPCSAMAISSWNGSRSTASSAGGSRASSMAA